MVASSRLTVQAKTIKRLKQGIDNVPALVFMVADEAVDVADRNNLPQITAYPRNEAILPFEFATENSRKFYFAVIVPRNRGGRFQRTGSLRNSWQVERTKGQFAYRARLWSNKTWAQYVLGNLMKQRQVPGHARTGWQLVADNIENWQSDVLTNFFRIYATRVGDLSELSIL